MGPSLDLLRGQFDRANASSVFKRRARLLALKKLFKINAKFEGE
jgi:hypothetical protein